MRLHTFFAILCFFVGAVFLILASLALFHLIGSDISTDLLFAVAFFLACLDLGGVPWV